MESKFLNPEVYNKLKAKQVMQSNEEVQKALNDVIETIKEERSEFYSVMTELLEDNRQMKQELRAVSYLQIKHGLLEDRVNTTSRVALDVSQNLEQVKRFIGVKTLILVVGALAWIVTRLV